jgi:ubiquinone/menaquinone biosynthesis C-methylase UbiE
MKEIKKMVTAEEIWDHRSKTYDKLYWVQNSQFLKQFIDICSLNKSLDVLDIGSGTGKISQTIAPFVNSVTGIDISDKMIENANNQNQFDNVCYVKMNVEATDFPSDKFDLVTARMVFHHVKNLKKGFQECYRVLKKGGQMVVSEGVPPDYEVKEQYAKIFEFKEDRHIFYESDLINLMHDVGFRDIQLRPFYMEQVSLNNWLKNANLPQDICKYILQLHLEADEHFKKVYRMKVTEDDIYIDWKFATVAGIK